MRGPMCVQRGPASVGPSRFTHCPTCQTRNQCCASCRPSRWTNSRPRRQKSVILERRVPLGRRGSTLCILSSIYVLLHYYQRGARRIADCDLRCKTYRESRHGTAGRGEGVTSRCQTVPRLRDVPKGAHNWFANQSIDRCYWLVSAVISIRSISHTNAQRSLARFFVLINSTRSHAAPSCVPTQDQQGISPYLCASTMIYLALCILQCFSIVLYVSDRFRKTDIHRYTCNIILL